MCQFVTRIKPERRQPLSPIFLFYPRIARLAAVTRGWAAISDTDLIKSTSPPPRYFGGYDFSISKIDSGQLPGAAYSATVFTLYKVATLVKAGQTSVRD
jgi:hypothetical protein